MCVKKFLLPTPDDLSSIWKATNVIGNYTSGATMIHILKTLGLGDNSATFAPIFTRWMLNTCAEFLAPGCNTFRVGNAGVGATCPDWLPLRAQTMTPAADYDGNVTYWPGSAKAIRAALNVATGAPYDVYTW